MDSERKKKVLIMQIGATILAIFILVVWILNLQNVWRIDKELAANNDSAQWLKIKDDLNKTLSAVQSQMKEINQAKKKQEDIKNRNFLSDLVDETKKFASTTVATSTPIATSPATSTAPKAPRLGCPEWINCMPSIGETRSCQIPVGCEGITQIAY